ncbi:MAG: NAD(P)H-dependent oxidoreductase subunit E [Deltaproteobacteria bacterium]|nr:NAD(P)H-dependent oxidoreductase subunit E [Deltaproteobacteria bacterium]
MDLARMSAAHEVLAEFRFDPAELHRGYAGRTLRIDVGRRDFRIDPVTRQMKDLWVGGKGFDLWLMFQEISAATRWDSPENPICFSSGPLGGVTSFPGAGKTIVTSVSPATGSIMDCNVGGWFGPYLKFTGFDALVITGRSDREVIVFIDGVDHRITIEAAPLESIDSHVVAEELTLLYAEDDADRRNLAVVSSGTAAAHSRMGVLNFSFWDWRRNVARLKQAGRGGIGTVFRHKGLKALVLRRRGVNPAWTITGSPASRRVQPPPQPSSGCRQEEDAAVAAVIGRHGSDPQRVVEMMLDLQRERRCISREAIEIISRATGTPRAWIYHVATFHDAFSLVPRGETSVEVCLGNACRAAGAETILQALQDRLGVTDGGTTADGRYTLRGVPCLGACSLAPAVRRGGHLFGGIREKDLAGLLDGSLAPAEGEAAAACMEGCGNALRHRGRVDPGRIETALGRGVFEGARRALSGRPEAVIDALAASELRGHGGGGFPAADKWTACRRAAAERGLSPVVICNANTDAAILESDPFSVLEGMLIAGWAVGATEGILYVRADNAAALVCASRALEQARDRRLLGQDVMGTGHAFDVTVRRAAGGFVAGEATAAVSSLGGRHAEPFPRWIRLAEQGLGGRPTLVSNVETLVNVPLVLTRGPSWFREHQASS